MEQWFVMNAGKQLGPMDADAARLIARESPGAWCWKQGMPDWQPIYQVPQVRAMKKDGVTPFPDPTPDMVQPKPSGLPAQAAPTPAPASVPARRPSFTPEPNASGGYGLAQTTDGVDFKLYGTETQFIELELDPGESAVAEAGAMMYKTCDVQMETIFGDGSNQSSGLLGSLFGAGKRMLTGESLFTTVFSQQGSGKGRVAFAAPYPGTILPLNLRDFGGKLICQKDSFLAGAKGVPSVSSSRRKSSPACSGAKVSSCKSWKATAGYSYTWAARCARSNWRRAKRWMSTPAAWQP